MNLSIFNYSLSSRYSLRSIEKFAPWILKVFIVTNGQVPDWLDANHPKVQIIPHELIFPNKSVLPTFSSSAIEMNLHRIPGLSEHFIYFNDDVFLGQPVYPYDFYTLEKGQIMYFSWDVPSCSDRCLYENLGDGFCDEGCFNPQCGFDLGDCSDREYIPHTDKISMILREMEMISRTTCNNCNTTKRTKRTMCRRLSFLMDW